MLTTIEEQQLKSVITKNIDMHKRRVINASGAVDLDDYVTLRQITTGTIELVSKTLISTDVIAHHLNHESGGLDEISVTGLNGLLHDQQDPLPHHARHEFGGVDPIKLDNLDTPDDNLDLNSNMSNHGLLFKLFEDGFLYLNSDGYWGNPLPQELDVNSLPLFDTLFLETALCVNSPITTVNGTTSGSAEFNQSLQGSSHKRVMIYGNNLRGDATYTFPVSFTNIPASSIPAFAAAITAISTTSVTVTGFVAETGFIELFGY